MNWYVLLTYVPGETRHPKHMHHSRIPFPHCRKVETATDICFIKQNSMYLDWFPAEEDVPSWIIPEATRHLNGCKFFVIGERLIGIAPEAAQESGVLFIIKKTHWPCLLRPAPGGRWQLVSGDCYVMDLEEEVGYKELQFSVGGTWDGPRIEGWLDEEPEKLEVW